jgi:hypothetical protein
MVHSPNSEARYNLFTGSDISLSNAFNIYPFMVKHQLGKEGDMATSEHPVYRVTFITRWLWLYGLGGIAAMVLAAIFVFGLASFLTASESLAVLQNNWLIVLLKLNFQYGGVDNSLLNQLNVLDLVIMALFGTLFLSLYSCLYSTRRILSLIATALPFLGIVIFLITHTAGRSGLLIGVLIFSAIMLGSRMFSKLSAVIGMISSSLLFFTGDIATAVFPPSNLIAILIAIGYLSWIVWLVLVGIRLFQLGNGKSQPA